MVLIAIVELDRKRKLTLVLLSLLRLLTFPGQAHESLVFVRYFFGAIVNNLENIELIDVIVPEIFFHELLSNLFAFIVSTHKTLVSFVTEIAEC